MSGAYSLTGSSVHTLSVSAATYFCCHTKHSRRHVANVLQTYLATQNFAILDFMKQHKIMVGTSTHPLFEKCVKNSLTVKKTKTLQWCTTYSYHIGYHQPILKLIFNNTNDFINMFSVIFSRPQFFSYCTF